MRQAVIAVIGVCALALSACGGGGDDTTASSSSGGQPEPRRPIAELVQPFNETLAKGDCETAAEAVFSVLRASGENGPATKKECEYLEDQENSFLNGLADVEFTDSEEYGTAALMEGELPKKDGGPAAAALWVLDRDGEFHYVSTLNGDAQLGTSLPDGNDADEVAAEFVDSVRGGKCDPDRIDPEGTLAQGNTKAACDGVLEGEKFAPAVKADKGAAPEKIGETLDWAFYGVDTKDGYFTLILNSLGSGPNGEQTTEYGVYDVLLSSPAA